MGSLKIIVDKINGGIFIKNGVPQITGTPLLLGGNASASIVRQNLAMLAAIEPFAKAVDGFTKQTIGEPVVPHTHKHLDREQCMDPVGFWGRWTVPGLTFGNMLGLQLKVCTKYQKTASAALHCYTATQPNDAPPSHLIRHRLQGHSYYLLTYVLTYLLLTYLSK